MEPLPSWYRDSPWPAIFDLLPRNSITFYLLVAFVTGVFFVCLLTLLALLVRRTDRTVSWWRHVLTYPRFLVLDFILLSHGARIVLVFVPIPTKLVDDFWPYVVYSLPLAFWIMSCFVVLLLAIITLERRLMRWLWPIFSVLVVCEILVFLWFSLFLGLTSPWEFCFVHMASVGRTFIIQLLLALCYLVVLRRLRLQYLDLKRYLGPDTQFPPHFQWLTYLVVIIFCFILARTGIDFAGLLFSVLAPPFFPACVAYLHVSEVFVRIELSPLLPTPMQQHTRPCPVPYPPIRQSQPFDHP